MSTQEVQRRPAWLKVKLPGGEHYERVHKLIQDERLHTVCRSARCPNLGECWNRQTATFMIMGDVCTRDCRFCAVKTGKPGMLDQDEPARVAGAVKALNLRYAVVTSVTRDDLPDGGAYHFAATIQQIHEQQPGCRVEVLIPDFKGSWPALKTVLDARPDILNHNIETVPHLYPLVRPQADYNRSLQVLQRAADYGVFAKSGIMVGLGETIAQVHTVMQDLLAVNCKRLTIGQYLAPDKDHAPVDRFVTPEEFAALKQFGLDLGFAHIESGPLVRSSYHADEQFMVRDEKE